MKPTIKLIPYALYRSVFGGFPDRVLAQKLYVRATTFLDVHDSAFVACFVGEYVQKDGGNGVANVFLHLYFGNRDSCLWVYSRSTKDN